MPKQEDKPKERYRVGLELLGSVEEKKVLDAGCGFGTLEKFIPAIGVDRHLKNLRQAKSELREESFVAANLSRIPFPDRSFDAIIMLETLEHVEDENGVLLEINRLLKDGGLFVLSVPNHHLLYNIIDLEHWLVPLLTRRAVHRHYKEKLLREDLLRLGFQTERSLERGMLFCACIRWFYVIFDLLDYLFFRSLNGPFGRGVRKLFDWLVDLEFRTPTFFGGTLFLVARKGRQCG